MFTLPDVEVGSIIEYRYFTRISDYIFESPIWMIQDDLYVKEAHFAWWPTNRQMIDEDEQPINSISWFPILPADAKIESHGTLTAVGASFTEAGVPVPGAMAVSVAGRIRLAEGSAPVELGLKFSGPSVDTLRVEMTAEVGTGDARPYDGRRRRATYIPSRCSASR